MLYPSEVKLLKSLDTAMYFIIPLIIVLIVLVWYLLSSAS
jgi:hypothetical protein